MSLMLMAVIAHTPCGPLWPLPSSHHPCELSVMMLILQMKTVRHQEVKAFGICKGWSCAGPTPPPRTLRSALWVGTITKPILWKRKWNVRENK